MNWWKIGIIAAVVLVTVIIIGKVADGLQGIWKVLCFPFILIFKLFNFIFKK